MTLPSRFAPLAAGLLALLLAAPAAGAELLVSAAASLTNAFRDLGKRFEAAHPGDTVVFNFAASDVLLAQIDKGAPVDAFASADEATMDRAAAQDRIVAATRRDFAANRLVIVVPKGAPAVASADALRNAAVHRIAIGSPESVPAGRYARDALEAAGAWATVEGKLIRGQNVRQVLDYVARGEVDAGFVYGTDAALMPERVVVTAIVPVPRPVTYPIAVVAGTKQRALADAFVAFVAGSEGRAILERYGFVAAGS